MVYSKRFERKYIIDYDTYTKIKKDLEPYFKPDKHGDKEGYYIVSSLYCDSSDLRAYREKVNGEKIRSKVRIRVYTDINGKSLIPNNKVFLEIKKRDNLNVLKKKIIMNKKEALNFIERPTLIKDLLKKCKNKKELLTLAEVMYLKTLYDIRPFMIITYGRQALINKFGPEVRITFDKNIKYRAHNLEIEDIYCKDYSLDPRLIVMEIKYNEILPTWISQIIGKYSLNLNTFGKYCKSVENEINKREEFINKLSC